VNRTNCAPRAPRARLGSVARVAVMAVVALALAACYSTGEQDRPAKLNKVANSVRVRRVWDRHLRRESPKLRLGLDVAVDGQRVFVASHNGEVEALDLRTGRRLWARRVRAAISGGPGAGAGLVVVGGSMGEVVALSESDGQVRWQRRVNSEILSAPAVGNDFVVVRGVDGRLQALRSTDGTDSWLVVQEVPRLSLRGTSDPILVGRLAICGFDNGHVMAIDRTDGMTVWDAAVDQPHGSSELQRLIDVDGDVVSSGDDVFAVAYQGRLARLARDNGRAVWSRQLSSYRGMAVSDDAVFVSGADGTLFRLNRRTGLVEWQQKLLANRQLSAPVLYRGRLVVGDLDGYVHWFDPANGHYLARMRAGKRLISAPPIVAGGLLLVFNDGGELTAFEAPEAPTSTAPAARQTRLTPAAPAPSGAGS
jgi:outer membrane protein assembly factor BamB